MDFLKSVLKYYYYCVFYLFCVNLNRLECRSSRRRRCRGGQSSSSPLFYCITACWLVRLPSNQLSRQWVHGKYFHTFNYLNFSSFSSHFSQPKVWCICFHDCRHSEERCCTFSSLRCTFLSLPYRSPRSRRVIEYYRWNTELFNTYELLMKHWQFEESPSSFSYCTVSCESQLPFLCSYLALPCNLFQLFQDHQDTSATLIQRYDLYWGITFFNYYHESADNSMISILFFLSVFQVVWE